MARYIPILRWKRGERVALQRLTAVGRNDVVPLIMLSPEQYNARDETASRAAMTAAESFVRELRTAWGTDPFFLDASALPPRSNGRHRILAIAVRARAAGLHLIPATRLGAPAAYQNAVDAICGQDQRGVGLRVDLPEFTSAASWVPGWIRPIGEIDLIADFSDNVGNVAALGGVVNTAFNRLHRAGSWRTVTIAGVSLPANFTGFSAGLHRIRREEWHLWQRVAAVTTYDLDYGDYTTVSPSAPPPGIAWGYPINVKYTLDADFLICRGVKTTGPGALDMDVQLLGHARAIRGYAARSPLAHCWADGKIDRIAAGTEGAGNLETWVQIGVNRHIELVRDRLP